MNTAASARTGVNTGLTARVIGVSNNAVWVLDVFTIRSKEEAP